MHFLVFHIFKSIYPVSYQIIAAYFAEHRGFCFRLVKLHKLFFFPLKEVANSLLHEICRLPSTVQKLEQNSEPKVQHGKAPSKQTFKILLLLSSLNICKVIQQHSRIWSNMKVTQQISLSQMQKSLSSSKKWNVYSHSFQVSCLGRKSTKSIHWITSQTIH